MDSGELRKRIIRALDDAQKEAKSRRTEKDQAAEAWTLFLADTAVPMVRQAANVLRAEGHAFVANAPAGGVRLTVENSSDSFIEFTLDTSGPHAQVIGRVSVARGRNGHIILERAIGDGRPLAELQDDDVSAFLVAEIPKLIVKT